MTPLPISVVTLAKQPSARLTRALKSVAACAERIVVLDAVTPEQRVAGATRVIAHKLDGFGPQKNRGVAAATEPWVLVLDDDEWLSRDTVAWLATAVEQTAISAYRFPRRNYVLGTWVQHGDWYPDEQLRLFRRGSATFTGDVHEQLQVTGKIATAPHAIEHETITSWHQYVEGKLNRYTAYEAQSLVAAGRRITRSYLVGKFLRTLWVLYIQRAGWRDGILGLMLAVSGAYYRFLAGMKAWELTQGRTLPATPEE